jgi:hypothetical protein
MSVAPNLLCRCSLHRAGVHPDLSLLCVPALYNQNIYKEVQCHLFAHRQSYSICKPSRIFPRRLASKPEPQLLPGSIDFIRGTNLAATFRILCMRSCQFCSTPAQFGVGQYTDPPQATSRSLRTLQPDWPNMPTARSRRVHAQYHLLIVAGRRSCFWLQSAHQGVFDSSSVTSFSTTWLFCCSTHIDPTTQ